MSQEKQPIHMAQEEELKIIACSDAPFEERLNAIRRITTSSILLRCVWGSNDIQIKHAAIARMDDPEDLRMLMAQTQDPNTRSKIQLRMRELYKKQGIII
ncbi:hypothetical protein LJC63_02075 [Ruminococcaceae bacterium OttesenSCG-928-L11]|nr:hypothetical protein [Ruminococcaceae bacterium OttesenSCG-928-L11]